MTSGRLWIDRVGQAAHAPRGYETAKQRFTEEQAQREPALGRPWGSR